MGAAAPTDPYARVEAADRLHLRAWAANSRLVRMFEQATLGPRLTAIMLGGMVEHFAHVRLDLGEQAAEETAVDHLTRLWARAIGSTDASPSARPEEGA